MRTTFLRAVLDDDKAAALRAAIRDPDAVERGQRYEVDPATFGAVPRSPFAYWASGRLRHLFVDFPPFESAGRTGSIGASTKNDFRYVRLSAELAPSCVAQSRDETWDRPWVAFSKGGSFSRYYVDVHLAVNWHDDGRELKADISEYRGARGWGYQWSAALNGHSYYFRPGLTWPRRTQGGLSLRAMPAGGIFADKGPAAFVERDDNDDLLVLLAICNTPAFRALVDLQMAFGSYEVGVIQRTPIPPVRRADAISLARSAYRAWSQMRSLDTRTEMSHVFTLPALLQAEGRTLIARAEAWSEHVRTVAAELVAIQADIDSRCVELYGLGEADRRGMTDSFGEASDLDTSAAENADEDAEAEDEGGVASDSDKTTLAAELISWSVGVAVGRFDVRGATGERVVSVDGGPFDPLPICSPGMLTGDDGLPVTRPPDGYPVAFPDDGILVDDPGHPRDVAGAVRAVLETVFEGDAETFWQEAAVLLDPRDADLRGWLAAGFFDHHLRHYSKSRRKAPILWQFGVPSGRYSVWCYAPRLTRDTFFVVQNDIVFAKLEHEDRRLSSLIAQVGPNPSAKARRQIDAQEDFVEELRILATEVRRVAPLWEPNFDDGVVLVMAPLWRLVRAHKAWQKELREKWNELAAGKHDWAHIAMHLWPERVVPKCASDRSLAIAHGLEDAFWTEGPDGKWTRRASPSRSTADLVAERTLPAVKAALAQLLEAEAIPADGRRRPSTPRRG